MSLRVSTYSTNSTGYTFREWCEVAGFKDHSYKFLGPKERAAWKADEDPCDWLQANRQIERARHLGAEANLNESPEPPWRGKDLFTLRRRRAWMEGFHDALYSRTRDRFPKAVASNEEDFVGPGVRPCQNRHCGDYRCKTIQARIDVETVEEIMGS